MIQRQTRSVGKRTGGDRVNELQKVAILCTRKNSELLVFQHDRGGVQVPAGTVEFGEEIATAAIRELHEETGVLVQAVTALFPERWEIFAENQYIFRCYWAPLDDHGLIEGHSRWVERALPLFPRGN